MTATPDVVGPPGLLRPASPAVPIAPHERPVPRVVDPVRRTPQPVDRVAPPPVHGPRGQDVPPQARITPVVVEPGGQRTSVRGRDGGGPPADGRPASASQLAGPGTLCRICGRQVPPELHFCRCGTQVSDGTAAAASGGPSGPDVRGMTRQSFDRVQRHAAGGRRVRFDLALAFRTWLFRALLALLLVAGAGSQLPPWGDDVRGWLADRIGTITGAEG